MTQREKDDVLKKLEQLNNMTPDFMHKRASNIVYEAMSAAMDEPKLKATIVYHALKALPQMTASGDVAGYIGSLLAWTKEEETVLHNKIITAGIDMVERVAAAEKTTSPSLTSDAAELVMRLLMERKEERLFNMGVDLLPHISGQTNEHQARQTIRLANNLRQLAGEVWIEKGQILSDCSGVYAEFVVAPPNNNRAFNEERFHIFPAGKGQPARLIQNGWNGTIDELHKGFEPAFVHVRNFLSARVFNQIAGFAANGGIAKMQEAPSLKAIFKAKIAGDKTVRHMPWPNIAPLKKHEVKL